MTGGGIVEIFNSKEVADIKLEELRKTEYEKHPDLIFIEEYSVTTNLMGDSVV